LRPHAAALFFFSERKFGDIERLSTASLTNGLTDRVFGTSNYSNPLGASYPPVKTSGQSSQSQTQKSLSLGESVLIMCAFSLNISA